MSDPAHEIPLMPVLCDLDAYPKLSLQLGVGLMFYALDRGDLGFNVSDIYRDLRYDRTSTTGAATALSNPAYECMTVIEPTTTRPTRYIATENLGRVGGAYNSFVAEIMAGVITARGEAITPLEVTSNALRRLVFGINQHSSTPSNRYMIERAISADSGHPESVTYRSLSSLAIISGIDIATTAELRRIVRRERLGHRKTA
jgi:hypothetical protein